MPQKTLKAQILLVTILVLMIIAIIVVGVISLANRDVAQTISEQQYQQILNASEAEVLELISVFGALDNPYDDIITAEPGCNRVGPKEVECLLEPTQDEVETEVTIVDTNEIEEMELTKDESFELDLVSDPSSGKGFRGEIVFNYTGNTSLEFALDYLQAGEIRTITDVFDVSGGVFDIAQGDPLDNSDPKHPFNFSQDVSGDYMFTINNIDGFAATAQPVSLRVTARMSGSQAVTLLDISGNSGGLPLATAGVFPNQVRKLTADSYFQGEDANIATTITTYIPLLPQAASFLHHGFLTPGSVSK